MQKSISVKHFHNTQEGWREKAGGRHEGPEQFHRTSSFQNGRSLVPVISPWEGGFYVQATLPAIAEAPLHFRNLQVDIIKALKGSRGRQGYQSVVYLSPEAKKELEWWRDYLKMSNGKRILPLEEQDTIFTNASKQGWGAFKSSKNRGSMDLGGKGRYTHKYAGIKSGFSCLASFSSPTKTAAHTVWHKQQNSSNLHQQIGGNPFTSSDISSLRDVEFCSRQKPNFVSSVCFRRGKSYCRQKVKGVPGQPGMNAASSSVSGIAKRSWLLQYRSLCNTFEPSGSCVCQLETRAWGSCHRCFQCKMGFYTGKPIPSLLYDQKMSQKNSTGSVTLCPDHTSVEKQTLVSSHSVFFGRAAMASSKTTGSSETSRHQKHTPPVPSKNSGWLHGPFQGESHKERICSESFRYPSLLLEKENCQSI